MFTPVLLISQLSIPVHCRLRLIELGLQEERLGELPVPVLVFGGAPRPLQQRRPQRADRQPGQVVLRRVLLRLGQRRVIQGIGQGLLLPEVENTIKNTVELELSTV